MSINAQQCMLSGSDQRLSRRAWQEISALWASDTLHLCTVNLEVPKFACAVQKAYNWVLVPTVQQPAPSQDHGKDLVRKSACFIHTLNALNKDSITASSTSAGADPDLLQGKCPAPHTPYGSGIGSRVEVHCTPGMFGSGVSLCSHAEILTGLLTLISLRWHCYLIAGSNFLNSIRMLLAE